MNMNLPRVNNCTMRNLLRILDMNPSTSNGLAAKIRLRDKAVDNLKLAVFDVMLAQMSERIETVPAVDYEVSGDDSLYLVRPLNSLATAHLKDNVSAEAMWWSNALVVEPRYIADLVEGLRADGWVVSAFSWCAR